MDILTLSGATLAVAMYIPLNKGILKGEVKQNIATFLLWITLDLIAAISTWLEGGNFLLPLVLSLIHI
jgi:hypothetical protein